MPAYPCCPGKKAVKRVCVCVCVRVRACMHACVRVCVCVCVCFSCTLTLITCDAVSIVISTATFGLLFLCCASLGHVSHKRMFGSKCNTFLVCRSLSIEHKHSRYKFLV